MSYCRMSATIRMLRATKLDSNQLLVSTGNQFYNNKRQMTHHGYSKKKEQS